MRKNHILSTSSILSIFIISLLLMIPTYSQQCNTCISLAAFGCNVCYDSCTTNQTNQFKSCSYTYCSSYSYDQNGTSSCDSYETKELPQNECFSQCCQQNQTYFTVDLLKSCQQKSKKRITIAIAVSVSVFGIIVIIFFICCCRSGGCPNCSGCSCPCSCYCIQDCFSCFGDCLCYIFTCRCCRRRQQVAPHSNSIQLNNTNLSSLEWQQQKQLNQTVADQTSACAICLINRVNALTRCKHYFHAECILQWYNRNPHCPLCKSQNVRYVKYFCRGCCTRYVEIDLNIHKNIQNIIKQVKGPNCNICQ